MNFFKKLWMKFRYPLKTYTPPPPSSTDIYGDGSGGNLAVSSGTTSNSNLIISNNSNYTVSITSPSTNSVVISSDSSRISVSLDDLLQYGRQGYLVKIMNLSVEDRKWLKEQLDTDSVDIA